MRPEVNSNRFEISNRFEMSFRLHGSLHGDFTTNFVLLVLRYGIFHQPNFAYPNNSRVF